MTEHVSSAEGLTLVVPLEPPSGNHYVRHCRGRHFKTREALAWYAAVAACAGGARVGGKGHAVEYTVYQGKGSRGDVDNYAKCILDGLTKAGVLETDASVVDLVCHKRRDRERPRTEITVREIVKG